MPFATIFLLKVHLKDPLIQILILDPRWRAGAEVPLSASAARALVLAELGK